MKILLINKYHYLRGGAERAYFDTARVLAERGHEVAFFSMRHPKNEPTEWEKYFVENIEYANDVEQSLFRKLRLAAKILWNREAQKKLEKLLDEFRPDVVHLHNIYHQLSPSILWTLKKRGIPIVMTLHDYKVICPNYSLFAHGSVWEKTKPKRYWQCVLDRCVKDSRAKSMVCTLEAYLHEWLGSYRLVDRFIAPSRFLIEKFHEFGFERPIEYVPQPLVPFPETGAVERAPSDAPFVYIGRLSAEKGVGTAINAMRTYTGSSELWIVGEGPERKTLEQQAIAANLSGRIKFLGAKHGEELDHIRRQAKALLIPSVWYENMPYTLLEALGAGKTVIVSDLGGMRERIRDGVNGFVFPPGDAVALAEKMKMADTLNEAMKYTANQEVLADIHPEVCGESVERIYGEVIVK